MINQNLNLINHIWIFCRWSWNFTRYISKVNSRRNFPFNSLSPFVDHERMYFYSSILTRLKVKYIP
jgi:hypothetical protein